MSGTRARPTWPLAAVLVAATSVVVGVIWDISWHRTIGRDTFWTPAHMAIYLGGVLAGCACGWLVLRTTFAGSDEDRAGTVHFWGFRGPLGAWVAIWGSLAMIASAPFDNWWHNAYGLDVKILSPPHVLLALGFTGIQLGALLMVLARQNGPGEGDRPAFRWGYAYAAGLLVANASIMGFEYIAFPNDMHTALFYQVSAVIFPILLVATARASRLTWPATTAAAVYVLVTALMVWILPIFPATARLAPIYRPVTHMVPPPFPILLIIPAFALDLLLHRLGRTRDWLTALAVGVAFVAVLFAVQWEVSAFLIGPSSENSIFGTGRWNYNSRPGSWEHEFWNLDQNPVTGVGLAIAGMLAVVSARLGLWWGNWMAQVRR